jgi:tetratricopeptide (TPR) repeat protein
MELRIKPSDRNPFPSGGILIQGASAEHWCREIQAMGFHLPEIRVFPIPHQQPNSVWGCLVVAGIGRNKPDIGRNQFCQAVHGKLFIPEKSDLYPRLSDTELDKLLGGRLHVWHPAFGMVALEEEVDWKPFIQLPQERTLFVTKPVGSIFIPRQVRTFMVKPPAPEESLQSLEEQHFPKKEELKDKPLNLLEKGKLFIYKQLFSKDKEGSGEGTGKGSFLSKMEALGKIFSGSGKWVDRMQQDFEDLEQRNQKQVDRLMDLFRKDPDEALKYAIPLDAEGTGRGAHQGPLDLSKRWADFPLGGRESSGGGVNVLPSNIYNQLHDQYWKTAQDLEKRKEYKKAAFVYLKLLKAYFMAAQCLEKAGLYQEAASVYLRYCHNKPKAAECYEQGKMYEEAIAIYKELGELEKVGDLYMAINKRREAFEFYENVAARLTEQHRHLKAALLYKGKMNDLASARKVLLEGWNFNHDAFNCLNNYFSCIEDERELWPEIQRIHSEHVYSKNAETFVRVLRYEFDRHPALSESIRDMACGIIAAEVRSNPSIISELHGFHKDDRQLLKDTIRFKLNYKKGK